MKREVACSALLLAAACNAPAGQYASQITVGKNIQVSTARADRNHMEEILAIDPSDDKNMLACSYMVNRVTTGPADPDIESAAQTVAYVTHNGGVSWKPFLEQPPGSWDPDCIYDANGRAYFISGMAQTRSGQLLVANGEGRVLHRFVFTMDDRPWIAARNPRDLYLSFYPGAHSQRPNAFLRISHDGAQTFAPPLEAYLNGKAFHLDSGESHPSFLSDGTLIGAIEDFHCAARPKGTPRVSFSPVMEISELPQKNRDPSPVGCLNAVRLLPGAQRLEVTPIGPHYAQGGMVQSLAVDPGSARYRDRVYLAWSDNRTGRQRILVTHSSDAGKTWSTPIAIDDGPWANPISSGPDNVAPTIAVNRFGTVLVIWEDRRDTKNDDDYTVRASASLDGGDSWLPSMRVSEVPNTLARDTSLWSLPIRHGAGEPMEFPIFHQVWATEGHTNGLEADGRGFFHALWVDDRTGTNQAWTATIEVRAE